MISLSCFDIKLFQTIAKTNKQTNQVRIKRMQHQMSVKHRWTMFDSVKHGHLNVKIIDFHYVLLYFLA